jgi:hypothetical protein
MRSRSYDRSSEFGPERLSLPVYHTQLAYNAAEALRVSQGKCTWHWTTVLRTLAMDLGLLADKKVIRSRMRLC